MERLKMTSAFSGYPSLVIRRVLVAPELPLGINHLKVVVAEPSTVPA